MNLRKHIINNARDKILFEFLSFFGPSDEEKLLKKIDSIFNKNYKDVSSFWDDFTKQQKTLKNEFDYTDLVYLGVLDDGLLARYYKFTPKGTFIENRYYIFKPNQKIVKIDKKKFDNLVRKSKKFYEMD